MRDVPSVSSVSEAFGDVFGPDRLKRHAPLAPLTTFRVGGPAEWLLETLSSEELVAALALAHKLGLPVTMLGGGSNVLIADGGVPGLVIRPRGGRIVAIDPSRIRAESAVTINGLVRWTILHGCGGLQAWAGTPGTVGGAIFGNAHFGGRLIGDLVVETRIASRSGSVSEIAGSSMAFGYDTSRLKLTGDVLLSAVFRVAAGEPSRLREEARASLAYRRRTQPLDTPSAGCIFQNPDPACEDRMPDGIPWSAGALIDRAGLKGSTIGGARISPAHGNFIVNDGTATARDIRQLIERCRETVRERFGVELREEIVCLGAHDV